MTIINYSEKSIAVTGNTYEFKEQLKALGGKYNPYLRCGKGWIFPASKRAAIESLNASNRPQTDTFNLDNMIEEKAEQWYAQTYPNDSFAAFDRFN